jgi:prevent-host-death family protein
MAQLTISRDIRPISDLKARASEIVTQAADTGRPVVLTRHGRGVAVVLAVDDYERLQLAAETGALVTALREAELDVAEGRTLTQEQMRSKWLAEDHEDD